MNSKLKIICSMLIFGSIGVFVKHIDLSSMDIAFMRAVIGSIFLVCASFFVRQKVSFKAIRQNLWLLILSGAAIGCNWILLFQAYKYTTISNATLSYYFAPVIVIIMSPIILKEKFSVIKFSSVVAAMIGLLLVVNTGGSSGGSNHMLGLAYGLSAACLYASAILINKFIKNLSGFETTLIQLMVAALVLLPSILYQGNLKLSTIGGSMWIYILAVGIIHTGAAYFLYFTSLKELKGQTIAILSYIDPISAVIIAALLLGETMTPLQMVGGVLILSSTFLSEKLEAFVAKQA